MIVAVVVVMTCYGSAVDDGHDVNDGGRPGNGGDGGDDEGDLGTQ